MVDPARIGRRIGKILFDDAHSDEVHCYVDFLVDDVLRWFAMYSVRHRRFTIYTSRTRGDPTPSLCSYLISIIPAEIKAHCTAASLGVTQPNPAPMQKEET